MTRILKVGDVGIDAAFLPDSMARIAKDGAAFLCRYSAGTATNLPKCAHPTEVTAATAAGMDFIGNFELAEDTPTQGRAAGREHGKADASFWLSRQYHQHAGVVVSWEPGNDRSKFTQVGNFLEAYRNNVGRPVGLYAGLDALLFFRRQGLIDFTWLPMAGSASGLNPPADQAAYAAFMEKVARDNGINLCQNRNRWYVVNGVPGADENKLITLPARPFTHLQAVRGSVGPVKPPQPPTNTPEVPVPVTKPDFPKAGPWAEDWTNPATGGKRTAAGWIIRIVQILGQHAKKLNKIEADVAAIRNHLGA